MEELLIEAVFKREPLWNPADSFHKHVIVLRKLWREVAAELNMDEQSIKMKWKNLRTYFFREVKRLQLTKSGDAAGNVTNSQWKYFEQLMFLKRTVLSAPEGDSILSSCSPLSLQHNFLSEEHENLLKRSHSPDIEETSTFEGEPESPAASDASRTKRKKYNTNSFHEQNHQILELEKRKYAMLQKDNIRPNSDMLFFESLIPYMAPIPMLQKLRLRSKIQDLIASELQLSSHTDSNVISADANVISADANVISADANVISADSNAIAADHFTFDLGLQQFKTEPED